MIKKWLSFVIMVIFFMSIHTPPITKSQSLRYVVISPVANIRMAPSLQSDVIHVVNEESEFLILQEVSDSDDKLWYKIKVDENKEGFIASWVIDSIKTMEKETPVSNKTVIIEAGVRIRLEPSLSSKIKTLVQSTIEKQVLAEIKDNENRTWYKIPMNDGTEAWVASWVVTIKAAVQEEKKSASDKLIIIGENVNIRKGPGLEFEMVTTITSYMEIRGIYEANDSRNQIWYMIRLPNNVEGWVASWVVEVKKYSEEKSAVSNRVAIIEPVVNVREGPSIQAKIVYTVQSRSEFPILHQGNDINGKPWYEIRINPSMTGWVASWVVTVRSTDPQNETKEHSNIRKGPGTDFEKIGEAPSNTPIQIEASAYTAAGESWFYVSLPSSKGWIIGSLLTISKNPIELDSRLLGSTFVVPPNTENPIYRGPGTDFPKTSAINQKSGLMSIVGIAITIQNDHWVQLKNNQIVVGWMNAELIPKQSHSAPEDQKKISGITWSKSAQSTTITLNFNEDGPYKFDTIVLSNPDRYVFDLSNMTLFQEEYRQEIKDNGIISIRATQFSVNPNIVRLVIEMDKDLRFLSRTEEKSLIFNFSDYASYEGPRLYINGMELDNHLMIRTHQQQLYIPLYLFSNMINSVLSWDESKKEAVMLMNRKEYRFKPDTKYVFFNSIEQQGRIELEYPISTFDQVLHLALTDFSRIFSTSLSSQGNTYYLDNTLTQISHSKEGQSLVYVFNFAMPARCIPQTENKTVRLNFHHSLLSSALSIPENPDLEKISSQQRTIEQASRIEIMFNLNQYASFETAMLEEGHQFVFTLKPQGSKGIQGKTIIIDPGHGAFSEDGYYDVGAIGPTGLLESVVNLKISLKLKELLEAAGAKVVLTRDQEQNKNSLKLQERIDMANTSGADFFLSVHNNASLNTEAKGSEVYYFRDEDATVADWVLKSLIASTGLVNRGVKQRGFAVTKNITTMPAILIECAFLSNPEEEKMLQSDTFLSLIAEGLFNGIKAYFDQH